MLLVFPCHPYRALRELILAVHNMSFSVARRRVSVREALFVLLSYAAAICAAFSQTAQDRRVAPIIAHKQVALVIGNSAYPNRPLANPVRDAQAMYRRLRELNFDVTLVTDADRRTMGQAVDQFLDKLGTGDVALFYYSGHGMQVDGENYLIPTDFQGQNETDVRYDAHPASRIQDLMERSGAQLNILILDACRDNPFRSATRGGTEGLAAMSPGRGTFIALATAPGHTASDNPNGQNGLFTTYLLDALSVPGLSLNDVFDLVRENVDSASKGRQLPWTLSSVVGRYSFLPDGAAAVPPPAVADSGGPQAVQVRVNPKDGQRYVWIPEGTFIMGCSPSDAECEDNEKPAHQVSISRGFWLGQTPVTQSAYTRVIGTNPSHFKGDNLPVESVSWKQANSYCEAVGGRLPTEAEWEYAARAGSASARYGSLDLIAWYGYNSGEKRLNSADLFRTDFSEYKRRLSDNGNGPHTVGQKQPNAWKLYDMLGNVWEWTANRYGMSYHGESQSVDPKGPEFGDSRALRGGSWYLEPAFVRVSSRSGSDPSVFTTSIGFRCVVE